MALIQTGVGGFWTYPPGPLRNLITMDFFLKVTRSLLILVVTLAALFSSHIEMRSLILMIVFSCYQLPGQSQTKLYLSGVVGQYSMSDLKQFQSDLQTQYNKLGIAVKNELNFPMSLQAELGFDTPLDQNQSYSIGGFINYGFTKGKIGYSDYSGETTASQELNRFLIGVRLSEKLPRGFHFYVKAGYNYSKLYLDFNSSYTSSTPPSSQSNKFHSTWRIMPSKILLHVF